MSTDSIRIHCNGCDYEYLEHFQPITLKCQIGDNVAEYHRTTAWCNQCDTIRYVERIPAIEELQKEYDEFVVTLSEKLPPTGLWKIFDYLLNCLFGNENEMRIENWNRERIKKYQDQIAWRQMRTAAPHCLTCGTTDLVYVDFEPVNVDMSISKNFRHSCGGALVIDRNDDPGIRINFARAVIWMDIDGNKLRDGEYVR